jgi:hypothetical protein
MDESTHRKRDMSSVERGLRPCQWGLSLLGVASTRAANTAKAVRSSRFRYLHEADRRGWRPLQVNRGAFRHQLARRRLCANQGAFQTGDSAEIMNQATCLSRLSNAALVGNTVHKARHNILALPRMALS